MSKSIRLATSLQLSEPATPVADSFIKDIQVLKVGNFFDPRYKKFPITEKMLSEMVENFQRGVRGIVPALDYAHETDGPAAGWFKSLFIKDGAAGKELWGSVEFTPRGQKSLSDKEYGYTSSDFDEKYADNETGKKYGCVFQGAALTNRPVIKRMASTVQLSEQEKQCMENEEKELSTQDPAALMKIIADLKAEIAKLKEGKAPAPAAPAPEGDMKMNEDMQKKLSEATSKEAAAQKELSEMKAKLLLAEKETEFSKLLSEGKAVAAQKEAFLAGDMTKFIQLSEGVKLKPAGNAEEIDTVETEDQADVEIDKLAKKLSEEKKISYRQAVVEVMQSNKQLAEKRQK